MFKSILVGLIISVSSSAAANILSPNHPLGINNPLSPINLNNLLKEDEEKKKDIYEQRSIVFKKAIPQTASYSYVIFLDLKTNKLLKQRACYTVNTKVNKTYKVSYNVTKNYYSLSCEYLK